MKSFNNILNFAHTSIRFFLYIYNWTRLIHPTLENVHANPLIRHITSTNA